jgi:U2 small nuclear ribonucleoprotein B''
LKKSLYALFSTFGRVIDVVTMRTDKLRGQAWIVFSDVSAATIALRELNGTPLDSKPMVRYTTALRVRFPRRLYLILMQRIQFAHSKSDVVAKAEGGGVVGAKRKRTALTSGGATSKAPAAKRVASAMEPGTAGLTAEANKVLLASNIPGEATDIMMRALFGKYAGLKDIRLIPERGLAFIEYETEGMALPALQGLNNFRMTATHVMNVTFAKK